jgi:hypothetical protein
MEGKSFFLFLKPNHFGAMSDLMGANILPGNFQVSKEHDTRFI